MKFQQGVCGLNRDLLAYFEHLFVCSVDFGFFVDLVGIVFTLQYLLHLKTFSDALEFFAFLKDDLLLYGVSNEAVYIGSYRNFLSKTVEDITLNFVHDCLNEHELVLFPIDFEDAIEVKA